MGDDFGRSRSLVGNLVLAEIFTAALEGRQPSAERILAEMTRDPVKEALQLFGIEEADFHAAAVEGEQP